MEAELIFVLPETQALVKRIEEIRYDQRIHAAIAVAVWLTYHFSKSPIEWIGALKVAGDIANKYLERLAEEKEEE